jgi:hypothetical protein
MLLHPRMMLSWAQKMKRPFSPSCRQTIDLGAPTTTYLFLILTVIMSLPLALWSAVLRKCLVECSSKHEDLAKTMVVDRPFADMVQLPQPFWASKASSFDGSQLLGITPHHWTSRDDDECGWVGDGVGEGKIREEGAKNGFYPHVCPFPAHPAQTTTHLGGWGVGGSSNGQKHPPTDKNTPPNGQKQRSKVTSSSAPKLEAAAGP